MSTRTGEDARHDRELTREHEVARPLGHRDRGGVDHRLRDPGQHRRVNDAQARDALDAQRAVYAVVAIIGSTEEGSVDPLDDILALRDEFAARGLSFLVHADAAWAGYFCSMLPRDYHPGDVCCLCLLLFYSHLSRSLSQLNI